MSTAHPQWEAACFLMGLSGLYHLRPQTLLIAYCESAETPLFQPAQATILSSIPLMLCWSWNNELYLSRKFNIVEAFEQKGGKKGVYSGKSLVRMFKGDRLGDVETVLGLNIDNIWLLLRFSSSEKAQIWKKAANRLLKAYFHPKGSISPRTPSSVKPCLGLLFDISYIDTPTGLKLTFLQPATAQEEFCPFEKGQNGAVERETALGTMRNRVDPGGWGVLQLFAEEERALEDGERQGKEGREWLLGLTNAQNCGFPIQIALFKPKTSFSTLKKTVKHQISSLSSKSSPAVYLLSLLSLQSSSLELAISLLISFKSPPISRSQPVSPHRLRTSLSPTNFTRPHRPSKPMRRPGKWYRDACDCHLY